MDRKRCRLAWTTRSWLSVFVMEMLMCGLLVCYILVGVFFVAVFASYGNACGQALRLSCQVIRVMSLVSPPSIDE